LIKFFRGRSRHHNLGSTNEELPQNVSKYGDKTILIAYSFAVACIRTYSYVDINMRHYALK